MEDSKTVVQQHGEARLSDESSATQSTWVKPTLKRLDLKDALTSKATTPVDGGLAPNHGS